MKRKINFKKGKNLVKVNMFPKLLFLIFAVVILVGIAIYYNISSTGKVSEMGDFTTFQTPQIVQNLDATEGFQIDTKMVKEQIFTVSVNKDDKKVLNNYKVNFTSAANGVIRYNLYINDTSSNVYVLKEFGLLNDVIGSTGPIFLDDDNVADLQVDYKDGIVMVLNLNYIEPEYSSIVLLNSSMNNISKQLLFVTVNQSFVYYFNVSSTKTPKVTAVWKSGVNLTSSEFMINDSYSGEDFVMMRLMFTPTDDKPYVLLVNTSVDDKSLVKQYIFAPGSVVYVLDEEKSPALFVKKKDNNYQFNFTFRLVTGLQAFSLPCGTVDLNSVDKNKIAKVYGYNNGVQQWVEGVPSEFGTLEAGKGYALKLKNADKPLSFVGNCDKETLNALVLPTGLIEGWNLIGIYGDLQDMPQSTFKKTVMPSGKLVKYVFEINNYEQKLYEGNLQVGKAYWVKVE